MPGTGAYCRSLSSQYNHVPRPPVVAVRDGTRVPYTMVMKKGATLGAGTTLTKDAPAGALTVSRSKQITIEGWKRPVKSTKK